RSPPREPSSRRSPTPGGGSIACITGALGVALVEMAIVITRKAAATGELDRVATALASARAELTALADADVAAFGRYMAALALPKADDAEKAARKLAIQSAALEAARAPLDAAQVAHRALALAESAVSLVKRSVLSDVLAGADILRGAAHAALRNVDINLPQIVEPTRSEIARTRVGLEAEIDATYSLVLALR
ncbi:MAG TPA: cyclodeaminase/cyclohydrolase family protein, partial [Polyangiaceae bacterium]|nr:cyclodeaminase/cyclohydrolase family protein [Polyangiaceae bacterium]